MFKKVQTRRVYVEIVEQIQQLIKERVLKPGDKLPPERFLAQKLGVSRPPLREALAALEILGAIETRGGMGNVVRNSLDSASYKQKFKELQQEKSPFELLEARKAIETEIARLAAKRATKEDIVAIQDSLTKMKSAISNIPKSMEVDRQFHIRFIEVDKEFHINVAKTAHNDVLFSIMSELAERFKEKLWVKLKEKSWSIPHHTRRYFEEHTGILNAIKNKDEKTAFRKMYDHLAGVEKDLLSEQEKI
jgi:GntR family transcriptional repressor for pyruvate dehydrogenase complex